MERQAEKMKEQGNTCFRKERYNAAIDAYTEAITLCPAKAIYWTNRALCHKKRNNWKQVEADCRKALELDKGCVKAHYLLGLALVESKQFIEGIKLLEKVIDLSKTKNLEDHVLITWDVLAKARYEEWKHAADHRLQKQQELRAICERAIKSELDEAVKHLEVASGNSTDDVIIVDDEIDDFAVRRAQAQEYQQRVRCRKRAMLDTMYEEKCHTLSEVFDKAAKCDRPSEIPDHLTCRITMDILRDPVITPSGITYEKSALLEHLRKVGEFDPWTRAPLKVDQIIPNFAIKKAVKSYLRDNGWAYKHE